MLHQQVDSTIILASLHDTAIRLQLASGQDEPCASATADPTQMNDFNNLRLHWTMDSCPCNYIEPDHKLRGSLRFTLMYISAAAS